MTTATITLRDGTQATIKGQTLIVDGLEDVPFIVHRDLQLPHFWMVTEPVTGARVLSRVETTRNRAIEIAKNRCSVEAARVHVKSEVARARSK